MKKVLKNINQRNVIEEFKDHSIKLIDSTTIDLCLSMLDWAKFTPRLVLILVFVIASQFGQQRAV
jgi:hypothetical protein